MNNSKTYELRHHRYKRKMFSCQNTKQQRGVSLIEVLIALTILTFGAVAIGNLQTAALVNVNITSSHYNINAISQQVMEQIKSDPGGSAAGFYNTDFSEITAGVSTPAVLSGVVNSWKKQVADNLTEGELLVQCSSADCLVSVRWNENTDGDTSQQVFNLRSPI